jgi:hypothetical protein
MISKRIFLCAALFTFMGLMSGCLSALDSDTNGTSPTSQPTGPLKPPAWIQGVWEGGSPIKLHLEFTAGNCYNASGKEQFVGYTETVTTDSLYSLAKDNMTSIFGRVDGSTVDWYVSSGTISNVTRMKKK